MGWIDYRKAYDMVPHRVIRKVLRAIRAPRFIRKLVEAACGRWRTEVCVRLAKGDHRELIRFRRGLFQGDSLSPLLFCLCVAPLSHYLRQQEGFRSRWQTRAVTHLMFMDDLKVYEASEDKLRETLAGVEEVSGCLGMSLGLRKCGIAHMVGGGVR